MRKLVLLLICFCMFPLYGQTIAQTKKRPGRTQKKSRKPDALDRAPLTVPETNPVDDDLWVRWKWIGPDLKNSFYFYDPQTIEREVGGGKVWVKEIQLGAGARARERRDLIAWRQKKGLPTRGFERYGYTLTREDFRCVQKEISVLTILYYDVDRKVIEEASPSQPEWKVIIPDTLGETIMNEVCKALTTPNAQ